MTALQLERLLDQRCPRCGRAAYDTNLCSACQDSANKRTRASMAKLRAELRGLGLCVDCKRRSLTYRCAPCRDGEDSAVIHTLDPSFAT